jgi:xanthine dehydrogenase small subunit
MSHAAPAESANASTGGAVDEVRFVLDGCVHIMPNVDPSRTVLQYLREDLGRTGTKEGCAEGDCGACTTVLAERVVDSGGERLRLRAINACIRFLPTLDGTALITVEGLRGRDALHPVQQAMVACHASQCGFCTPGIVMSLFALYEQQRRPDRAAIDHALSGNLCRCTGYRPVIDAAQLMGELAPVTSIDQADLLEKLRSIAREDCLSLSTSGNSFHAPRTLPELAKLRLSLPEARLVAGATDVGLWVTKQSRTLNESIYLGQVPELQRIQVQAAHIDIGAAATITDAAEALVREHPDLDELFCRFASPPIRNAATLGGNIANASPIGDSMPALIALGSDIVLRRGDAVRTISLEDFFVGYHRTALERGEFIERIRVPRAHVGLALRAYKLSKRFDQDISSLCGAFAVTLRDGLVRQARIAFGGMAETPRRAPRAEAALLGQPWTEASARSAMAALALDYEPISDFRATRHYRRTAGANLLYRFWLETSGCAAKAPTRLYDFRLPEHDDEHAR